MLSLREFIEENDLPTIYLDMDETIVDFYGGADRVLQRYGYPRFTDNYWKKYGQKKADDIRWSIINKDPNFWLNLKFTDDGRQLWAYVKQYKPHILSACTGQSKTCVPQKRQWIAKYLGLNNVSGIHLVRRSEKSNYAIADDGSPNILIDDYYINCNEFRAAGGIAIQVTSAADVIAKLKRLGFK